VFEELYKEENPVY